MQTYIDAIEQKGYYRAKAEFAEEKMAFELTIAKLTTENEKLKAELVKFQSVEKTDLTVSKTIAPSSKV